MGIKGLLPALNGVEKKITINDLRNLTIGIDAYVWLHKGSYSCVLEIFQNKRTTKYVDYCVRQIKYLQKFNIKPYFVFDGGLLPKKGGTEENRNNVRNENREKGFEYLKLGQTNKAYDCFKKSVDVTPYMAYQLIKELRKMNIDFVVAPYEADAQLAYLEKIGLIQAIITEDSDLLVFGSKRVIYKWTKEGTGSEICRDRFNMCRGMNLNGWNDEMFRHMCILSGCDYLPNIPKVGIKKAYTLVNQKRYIKNILFEIKQRYGLNVPPDYEQQFIEADKTFLYQRVFDPIKNQLVTLNPVPEDLNLEDMEYIGPYLEQKIAEGVAKGDLNPLTKEQNSNELVDPHYKELLKQMNESEKNSSSQQKIDQLKMNKLYRPSQTRVTMNSSKVDFLTNATSRNNSNENLGKNNNIANKRRNNSSLFKLFQKSNERLLNNRIKKENESKSLHINEKIINNNITEITIIDGIDEISDTSDVEIVNHTNNKNSNNNENSINEVNHIMNLNLIDDILNSSDVEIDDNIVTNNHQNININTNHTNNKNSNYNENSMNEVNHIMNPNIIYDILNSSDVEIDDNINTNNHQNININSSIIDNKIITDTSYRANSKNNNDELIIIDDTKLSKESKELTNSDDEIKLKTIEKISKNSIPVKISPSTINSFSTLNNKISLNNNKKETLNNKISSINNKNETLQNIFSKSVSFSKYEQSVYSTPKKIIETIVINSSPTQSPINNNQNIFNNKLLQKDIKNDNSLVNIDNDSFNNNKQINNINTISNYFKKQTTPKLSKHNSYPIVKNKNNSINHKFNLKDYFSNVNSKKSTIIGDQLNSNTLPISEFENKNFNDNNNNKSDNNAIDKDSINENILNTDSSSNNNDNNNEINSLNTTQKDDDVNYMEPESTYDDDTEIQKNNIKNELKTELLLQKSQNNTRSKLMSLMNRNNILLKKSASLSKTSIYFFGNSNTEENEDQKKNESILSESQQSSNTMIIDDPSPYNISENENSDNELGQSNNTINNDDDNGNDNSFKENEKQTFPNGLSNMNQISRSYLYEDSKGSISSNSSVLNIFDSFIKSDEEDVLSGNEDISSSNKSHSNDSTNNDSSKHGNDIIVNSSSPSDSLNNENDSDHSSNNSSSNDTCNDPSHSNNKIDLQSIKLNQIYNDYHTSTNSHKRKRNTHTSSITVRSKSVIDKSTYSEENSLKNNFSSSQPEGSNDNQFKNLNHILREKFAYNKNIDHKNTTANQLLINRSLMNSLPSYNLNNSSKVSNAYVAPKITKKKNIKRKMTSSTTLKRKKEKENQKTQTNTLESSPFCNLLYEKFRYKE